jgi:hypothetical protein
LNAGSACLIVVYRPLELGPLDAHEASNWRVGGTPPLAVSSVARHFLFLGTQIKQENAMAIRVSDDIARAIAGNDGYYKKSIGKQTIKAVDPNNPDAQARAHAEIKRTYDAAARANAQSTGKRASTTTIMNRMRICEIERLFKFRYRGLLLPMDHSGIPDLETTIEVILSTQTIKAARGWARRWAPWCGDDRFDRIVRKIAPIGSPRFLDGDKLADALMVDYDTRQKLKFRVIGSTDVKKPQREQIAKRKDATRQKDKRIKQGATPREQSLTQTKPWQSEGTNRTQWYEDRKKAEAAEASETIRTISSDTIDLYMSGTDLSETESYRADKSPIVLSESALAMKDEIQPANDNRSSPARENKAA